MKHWSVVLLEFLRTDFLPFPFPFPFFFVDFLDFFFLPFPFLDFFAFFLFFASLASLSRRDSPASDNVFSELTRLLDSCVAEASWKMQRRARARTHYLKPESLFWIGRLEMRKRERRQKSLRKETEERRSLRSLRKRTEKEKEKEGNPS
jgi:hypothetical protein